MLIFRFLLCVSMLVVSLSAHEQSLSYASEYRVSQATTSRLLSQHFESQKTNSSCSLASIAMVTNAILELHHCSPCSQEEILLAVADPAWAYDIRHDGDGISLERLSTYLSLALDAFNLDYLSVEVIHLSSDTPEARERFRGVLHELNNETEATTFVIANFDTGRLLPIKDGVGHFSPIGHYDETCHKILLMDVSKELESLDGWSNAPYWVDEDSLFRAMHTLSTDLNEEGIPFFRGYVILRL